MSEVTTNAAEQAVKKPYSFRPLNSTDVAPMCAIISKIGIDNFTKCFESSEGLLNIFRDKTKTKEMITNLAGIKIALDIANIILAHIPDCEEEIYTLLSNVSGLTVDEIKGFPLATFAKMVIDFVKLDDFGDFFKVVSELFN